MLPTLHAHPRPAARRSLDAGLQFPIIIAAASGHLRSIEELSRGGANLDNAITRLPPLEEESEDDWSDWIGTTALLAAAKAPMGPRVIPTICTLLRLGATQPAPRVWLQHLDPEELDDLRDWFVPTSAVSASPPSLGQASLPPNLTPRTPPYQVP